MSADSSWPLQQAIFTALNSDATLMSMITGVFDHVPQGTDFPYVSIGAGTARAWGAVGLNGVEATLALHVWSRSRGRGEAKRIIAEMHRVLHDADLPVAAHALVYLRFEAGQVERDPNGITYHGFSRYRAVTHVAA